MKKLTRRELLYGGLVVTIGAAAVVVGLERTRAAFIRIGASSRVGKSYPGLYPTWTPEVYLPSNVIPLEKAVRLSDIEAFAQKLAEQAAADAKVQGWEVSPEKIQRAKQRIIRNLRKSFEDQDITIKE